MAMQTLFDKILSRIYGHGRGWVFSSKDFADLGSLDTIQRNLARLNRKGTIRRVLRGVYHYPQYNEFVAEEVPPDPRDIASAISRIHGETITASGLSALNTLGLSTQVPATWEYLSDGPSREYSWEGGQLTFIHRSAKETTIFSPSTALLVQALKALGQENLTPEVISLLENKLNAKAKQSALREARYTSAWIYDAIKRIARGKADRDA